MLIVLMAALLATSAATSAQERDDPQVAPPMIWEVSDDTLAAPLGAIKDVAVSAAGVVFVLDSQSFVVRRFSNDGSELPALGRKGEGPGEFMHPILVAAYPDGRCIVVQDFHAPVVCFSPDGVPVEAPDVTHIRDRSVTTMFVRAEVTESGDCYLSTVSQGKPLRPDASYEDLEPSASVFRVNDMETSVIFTDRPAPSDQAVRLDRLPNRYVLHRWDVTDTGDIIYADPEGGYAVTILSADGSETVIALREEPSDLASIGRVAEKSDYSADELPRIARLRWLGDSHFIAYPMALALEGGQLGIFDVFDRKGNLIERVPLNVPMDPALDSAYLRDEYLVLVIGGRSAMESHLDIQADSANLQDSIHIQVYDAFAHFLAR